ncbi:SH3 domain-containing protein [Coleofasciculus sp. G2-EDA-02]|uniref:SH3 domain-containing protein n=1 Tax=Coleofasciculus sp. G2-EDA-02 TaxID=3069529 RepID=UPI0032F5396E
MKSLTVFLATITMISVSALSLPARAGTINAHCDFYPIGEDRASSSMPCTFSQHQGFIGIGINGDILYEFNPVGNSPGNYTDAAGDAVYRQAGLGSRGLIFQLRDKKIYVYWSPDTRIGTLRANNPESRINLRQQPTLNSGTNGYGLVGDRVTVLECRQDNDTLGSNLNWCKVQFPKSREIGWIRSDFIIFPVKIERWS